MQQEVQQLHVSAGRFWNQTCELQAVGTRSRVGRIMGDASTGEGAPRLQVSLFVLVPKRCRRVHVELLHVSSLIRRLFVL